MKIRSKVKAAVQDILFYISSNVIVISFVLLLSQIYFIVLINVPSLLIGYTCVPDTIIIHNNHKYGHELQRVESGFAQVPLSLLLKTVPKQLEL